jgi:hypothetical protein
MKKLIAILLFVFVYVTANAQQEIFVDELVGIKKPLTWDSTKKTINIPIATAVQDGYMSSLLVKKLDTVDSLLRVQAALILSLKTKVDDFEYRIGQLEINLRLTGSQVDINRMKIEGMNNILSKAMYDLINIK